MAGNSLYPGYVLLNYHSFWGTHKMTLPTRAWNPVPITGALGSWEGWNGTNIDGEAMIDALVALFAPFFLATSAFDTATVYTMASPTSPAIPVAGKALGVVGTNTTTLQAKAVQHTWTFRDPAYDISRLEFLDAPTGAGFEPVSTDPGSGPEHNLILGWTSTANAWSSRGGLRPQVFHKISYDLAGFLRKRYGMV